MKRINFLKNDPGSFFCAVRPLQQIAVTIFAAVLYGIYISASFVNSVTLIYFARFFDVF